MTLLIDNLGFSTFRCFSFTALLHHIIKQLKATARCNIECPPTRVAKELSNSATDDSIFLASVTNATSKPNNRTSHLHNMPTVLNQRPGLRKEVPQIHISCVCRTCSTSAQEDRKQKNNFQRQLYHFSLCPVTGPSVCDGR